MKLWLFNIDPLEISYWWGCHYYCCCCWYSQTFPFLWVAWQQHKLRLQGDDLQGDDGSDRPSFWLWFQRLLNHRRAGEWVIMVIENSFVDFCGVNVMCWCWLPAFKLASNGYFWQFCWKDGPRFSWVRWQIFEFRRSEVVDRLGGVGRSGQCHSNVPLLVAIGPLQEL